MNNLLKGSFGLMKQLNISSILEIIRVKGAISRAEIAEISGLTPASVSKITKKLIQTGIIEESGFGESSGGRPPVLLSLNPEAGYIVGVNLGTDYLEVILSDLEAKSLDYSSHRINKISKDQVLNSLLEQIENIINKNNIDKKDIIGIGMAVHGLVNKKTGYSIYAPHYSWENVPLKDLVENKFNIPTFIDNDVRAMALGEKWFGRAADINNFITVNISNGIGSGIIINEKLYYGADYTAGEFGHILVDNDGPRCSCGNYGCLESLASNKAIVKKAEKLIKQGAKTKIVNLIDGDLEKLNTKIVCEAANKNDEPAQQILKEIGRYLGIGISTLINILNPEMIVIVGEIIRAKEYVFEAINETIDSRALGNSADRIQLVATTLNEKAALVGGVTLVLKELFNKHNLLNESKF